MAEAEITARVAQEIRRLRGEQKLSAQKLSDRLALMGVDISRASISAIENGVRPYITAGELVAFALALNTSPVALIYPDPDDPAQLDGVRWFCADDTEFVPGMVHDPQSWVGNTRLLRLSRRLDDEQRALTDTETRAAGVDNPDVVRLLAASMEQTRKAVNDLQARVAEERARR